MTTPTLLTLKNLSCGSLLCRATLHIGPSHAASVQRVGQVGQIATERLQLWQSLLALEP